MESKSYLHQKISRACKSGSRVLPWLLPGIFLLFGMLGFINSGYEPAVKSNQDPQFFNIYPIDLPEYLEFAGERVPLENFDTRESLDRELLVNTFFHSQTFLYLKKVPRYFPVIEPILNEYNVPEDFKYLPLVESGLANAVSPAEAVGFWQLMEGTARDYGLEVNAEVDERYHLEKSTVAACKYLLKSYEEYHNWTLVAASYNNGRRGIDRQIGRQKENNYYDLLLNEETARYIFRILALKLIVSDPEKYGFHLEEKDLYQPIRSFEVKVDTTVSSFAEFAKNFGTNYKMLKFLNPWLREPYLSNNKGKSYMIKIPGKGSRIWKLEEGSNNTE
ncbi:MAG: lytic transglycosylase domain-containing protein [Bacteroidales bacterium]|nr:MAG: lytic transglycosylase domain-containing protein [Bacteroidales bacterium]